MTSYVLPSVEKDSPDAISQMPSSPTSAQDDTIALCGQPFSPLRPKSTINKQKQ